MKYLLAICVVALAGCNPLEPSMYRCLTQPRLYTSPAGVQEWMVDFYMQSTPCPKVPIR